MTLNKRSVKVVAEKEMIDEEEAETGEDYDTDLFNNISSETTEADSSKEPDQEISMVTSVDLLPNDIVVEEIPNDNPRSTAKESNIIHSGNFRTTAQLPDTSANLTPQEAGHYNKTSADEPVNILRTSSGSRSSAPLPDSTHKNQNGLDDRDEFDTGQQRGSDWK